MQFQSLRNLCVIAGAFFCRADEFICNNTLCKLHTWVCDGKDDCGDNSDEDIDMCGGLKLSLARFPLKTIDAYFIRHYYFLFSKREYFIVISYETSSSYLFYFFFKDISISFWCLFISSKTPLPSDKAIPLQKWSRVSTHRPSLQQSGWLWWQLRWRRVWWAQNAPIWISYWIYTKQICMRKYN